ncbi:MAG TPA: acyltransferase [Actinomycetota bacterium]|nr:acyltransferase [Actinomycetota bacterium]
MSSTITTQPVNEPDPRSRPTPTAPASRTRSGSAAPRHLDAVDFVRMYMVAGVIAIHLVGYTTNPTDILAGGVGAILHLNREVFFVLTAFVLTYGYGSRTGWSVWKFWKKRYLLIGVPYLVWTGIYFLADGSEHKPWVQVLHRLTTDLAQGLARYHLYFLLVTMQIYLLFPAMLWLLRKTKGHHGVLVAVALAYQLAYTVLFHYRMHHPAVINVLFAHADPLITSYPLYMIGGGVAALHLDELRTFVRTRPRAVGALVSAGFGVAVIAFLVDVYWVGQNAAQAGEVFQPSVIFSSAAAVLGLYTLGLRWADKGEERRWRRSAAIAADTSFAVYLVHPLLIQWLIALAAPVVTLGVDNKIPSAAVLPVDLFVVVPLLFILSASAMRLVRYTPLSLPVTGRPRRERASAAVAKAPAGAAA